MKENDIELKDYEVKDGATPEEIDELKNIKKINEKIDDIKLKESDPNFYINGDLVPKSKNTLSNEEVKKILEKYSDDEDKSRYFKIREVIRIDVGTLTPEESKKLIEDRIKLEKEKEINTPIKNIKLIDLSDIITDIEFENFAYLKTIDELKVKVSDLTQERELIVLGYQQDIYSSEKKKDYPNETSRTTALKEELLKDTNYVLIDKDIKTFENTITDLEYKEKKNNILKSNFKRVYDIKMRPVYVVNTENITQYGMSVEKVTEKSRYRKSNIV